MQEVSTAVATTTNVVNPYQCRRPVCTVVPQDGARLGAPEDLRYWALHSRRCAHGRRQPPAAERLFRVRSGDQLVVVHLAGHRGQSVRRSAPCSRHVSVCSHRPQAEDGPPLVYDHQLCMDQDDGVLYCFGGKVLSSDPLSSSTTRSPLQSRGTQTGGAAAAAAAAPAAVETAPHGGLYAYYIEQRKWRKLLLRTRVLVMNLISVDSPTH